MTPHSSQTLGRAGSSTGEAVGNRMQRRGSQQLGRTIRVRRADGGTHRFECDRGVHGSTRSHYRERHPRCVDQDPIWSHRLELGLRPDVGMRGEHGDARPPAEYALKPFREEGHTHGVAFSLAVLAAVAAIEGKAEQAARLIGAQRALLGGAEGRLPVEAFRLLTMLLDPIRKALGEEAWAKVETAGSALSLDNVIREAIGLGN